MEPKILETSGSKYWICSVFSYVLDQVSNIILREKMDYLCNCKSEIGNVCNPVEGHCLRAMKIVHHHANGLFDWLISGQQSVYPSREVIPILSGKYKRFTFVHRVADSNFHVAGNFFQTIRCKDCPCLYHKQFTGIQATFIKEQFYLHSF